MKVLPPDLPDAGLRRYLLGLLPETEAETLEEAYLANPELWERLRGVEHDLLDDYAADRLDGADKQAFESRYLRSPVLRERVVAARALHLAALSGSRSAAQHPAPKARWAGPVALAAGLFLALLSEWSGRTPPPERTAAASPAPAPVREPTPTASATSVDPSMPPPTSRQRPARIVSLALSPVLLRGQQAAAGLRMPAGTDSLVLELEGDRNALPASPATLEAIVETVEGQPVWRGEARRIGAGGKASLVATVRVPAAGLAPGDYLLTLATREADGALYRYFFRITP